MPVYNRKKMCRECPFRANAPRGWLGPWKPEDIETTIRNDQGFICHTNINKQTAIGKTTDEIKLDGQHCVGMLRYMNSMCKLSRHRDKADAQIELKDVDDIAVIPPRQFTNHHTPNRED